MMSNDNGLLRDLAAGALAGLAATWVMGQVTTYLYEHEDEEARKREDEARGGKTAYGLAAEKAAAVADIELSDEQRQRLGSGIHWVLGAGAGAVYGALRTRVPAVDAGHGLAFGTAFWGIVDEGANTALGLTPGPAHFPWQTHARGLAGHLVFGVVADSLLSVRERVMT
jgi:hypothetical protein